MSGTSLSTTTFSNSTQTDSVDGDDGIIDSFGRNGHRLFDRGNGTIGGIRFTFNRNTLGAFPTHVGIVWTDSYSNSSFDLDGSPLTFEAFNAQGISLGKLETLALEIGDGQTDGTTADDRFFGVTYLEGLSSIEISQNKIASGGGFAIEVDHLQYGYNIPIDPAQYGASYGDLITGIGYNLPALEEHYYNSGQFEGRQQDLFDEFLYIASNSDLIGALGLNSSSATYHYIASGYFEGRSLTGFIPSRYINSHDDLFNVFGTNTEAATQHYITNGFTEGRNPNLFPIARYIASHGDLIQTYRYNLEAGSNHYLYSGRGEGRQITFSPEAYLSRYGDLQAAFGNDLVAATAHYITNGFNEGRTWF